MTAWSEASHAPRIRVRETPRCRASPPSISPCRTPMARPAPSARRGRCLTPIARSPGATEVTAPPRNGVHAPRAGLRPSRSSPSTGGRSALRDPDGGLHLPAGRRVERAHGEDALDFHVEGDLHLRVAGPSGVDPGEDEVAEELVLLRLLVVPLVDAHRQLGLPVEARGRLDLLGVRDGRVPGEDDVKVAP